MAHELRTQSQQDEAYGQKNEIDAAVSRVERPRGDFQPPTHPDGHGHLSDAAPGPEWHRNAAQASSGNLGQSGRHRHTAPPGQDQPRQFDDRRSFTGRKARTTHCGPGAPSPARRCLETGQTAYRNSTSSNPSCCSSDFSCSRARRLASSFKPLTRAARAISSVAC